MYDLKIFRTVHLISEVVWCYIQKYSPLHAKSHFNLLPIWILIVLSSTHVLHITLTNLDGVPVMHFAYVVVAFKCNSQYIYMYTNLHAKSRVLRNFINTQRDPLAQVYSHNKKKLKSRISQTESVFLQQQIRCCRYESLSKYWTLCAKNLFVLFTINFHMWDRK